MEKIIGTVPGKCRKKREKARLTLNNNPEISWHMKKSRRTYNGVHLNKKSNTQDVVEQSLTIYREVSLYILFPEFKARFWIALEKRRDKPLIRLFSSISILSPAYHIVHRTVFRIIVYSGLKLLPPFPDIQTIAFPLQHLYLCFPLIRPLTVKAWTNKDS